MAETTISYAPRSDATSDTELSALASIYRFVLDSRAKKEAAPESRPEDEKERSVHDSLASTNYTR